MLAQEYLPTLRDLIKVDQLPDALGFLSDPLGNLLDKLYYANLVSNQSVNGDTAYYNLDVILKRDLKILTIPGTDISLVLNPPDLVTGNLPPAGSVFNVSFEYRWEVLKYIKGAKLSTFSFSVQGFADLLSGIFGITPEEMAEEAINVFIGDIVNPESGQDPVQDFVDHYNANYTPVISSYVDLPDVFTQISANHSLLEIILKDFVKDAFENLQALITKWVGPMNEERLIQMVTPYIAASLNGITLGLTLPRSVFIPLHPTTGVQLAEPAQAMIKVNGGALKFDTKRGIIFDPDLSFDFTKAEILNSGFTLEIVKLKVDLSETWNIPEATAEGRPLDFKGVFIEKATIGFPAFWNHNDTASTGELVVEDMLAGTGGLSGRITLQAKSGVMSAPLIEACFGSGFKISLDSFSLLFRQNSLLESEIKGKMKLPGFKDATGTQDAEILIAISMEQDGDFSVTATEPDGIKIKLGDILSFTIFSAKIGREDGRFFFAISGLVKFEDLGPGIGQFLPDAFEIQELIIWDDGQIEFKGGKITLPQAITLKIGPVELSVTAIGLGSHEQEYNGDLRQYKYFTFDGRVGIDPGGVEASGNGVSLYWTTDNDNFGGQGHFFVRIQSIAIDLVIPGSASKETAAVLLSGFLAMKNPENGGQGTEYSGGIDFSLPKLKMGGSAAMRLNPKVPAFLVDIGLEMSTPIVLGSTGLGIYGFRALLGSKYVATKNAAGIQETDPWWQYYKAKVPNTYREGINVDKFDQKNGFSLGAGVSLATVPDAGKAFSSKLFFLLSLPDVFMFQGQGQFLKERIGLDTTQDPPFFAMIAISNSSIETAFGVNYKIPDDGKIATIDGIFEMGFFWNNAGAWYINVGRDQPENMRVQARILTLFNTYFYLMISSQGIKTGAGASYELSKKFGPLRAELSAYLDIAGKISFKPKQVGASIAIGGSVGLYIWKFGFSVSAHASLAAEAPKPFIVSGELEACVRVLRKDRCAKFSFTWNFNNNLDTSENVLINPVIKDAAKAVNIQTREIFDLYNTSGGTLPNINDLQEAIVPMDSYIDIELLKGIKPSTSVVNLIGGNSQAINNIDYVAPQRGKSDRVRHEYFLDDIEIFIWDSSTSAWKTYDVYDAATPLQLAPFVTTNLSALKSGYWQYQTPDLHNKLRILAMSPLSYVSQGSGGIIPENSGITVESIFCGPEPGDSNCVTFDHWDRPDLGNSCMGDVLPINTPVVLDGVFLEAKNKKANIVTRPINSYQKALCISEEGQLCIRFTEAMPRVDLAIDSVLVNSTVIWYERVATGTFDVSGNPLYADNIIYTDVVPTGGLQTLTYNNQNRPVDFVEIVGGECIGKQQDPRDPTGGKATKADPDPVKATAREATATKDTKADPIKDTGKEGENEREGGQVELPPLPGCCDEKLTPYAELLLRFLNTMRDARHLGTFAVLDNSANYPIYETSFFNTILYPLTAQPGNSVYSQVHYMDSDAGILDWEIFNTKEEWCCSFRLEAIPPTRINFNSGILEFVNFRVDPYIEDCGCVYSFFVDAVIEGRRVVTLRGTSCYPIIDCRDDCNLYLYQICHQDYETYVVNQGLPSQSQILSETQTMINAFNGSIQPIWRANSHFAIRLSTTDKLFRENGQTSLANYPRQHVFGFRTAGPIGHFHIYKNLGGTEVKRSEFAALESVDQEDEYKLSRLLHYIDFPKCFPNADGQLIDAKPLYYVNPKLLMFYTQAYIYEMLRDWNTYQGNGQVNASMLVQIKDPAPDPNLPAISPVIGQWEENTFPVVSEDITILSNMITYGIPCANVTAISPLGVTNFFGLPQLKPLKLYTGIFKVRYERPSDTLPTEREVHRYGFQTSRYPDFETHVQSYILAEDSYGVAVRTAIFELPLSLEAAQETKALEIITDTLAIDDPIKTDFAISFDRLAYGVFKLPAIEPAESTEFNILRDPATSRVRAIWLRSPEPFNDPKLPPSELASTILMLVGGNPGFTAVISKDGSQAILTNTDGSLDLSNWGNQVDLEFTFKLWNGNQYDNVASSAVSFTFS